MRTQRASGFGPIPLPGEAARVAAADARARDLVEALETLDTSPDTERPDGGVEPRARMVPLGGKGPVEIVELVERPEGISKGLLRLDHGAKSFVRIEPVGGPYSTKSAFGTLLVTHKTSGGGVVRSREATISERRS